MDKKTLIMIGLAVIILILAGIVAVPKITNAYKMEGLKQGVAVCQQQILNTLVTDLSARGYTTMTIGNKVITLGIIQPEAQPQAAQQTGGAEQ